jgi:hypothetical protein
VSRESTPGGLSGSGKGTSQGGPSMEPIPVLVSIS